MFLDLNTYSIFPTLCMASFSTFRSDFSVSWIFQFPNQITRKLRITGTARHVWQGVWINFVRCWDRPFLQNSLISILTGYARNAKASTVQLNLCFISVMVSCWLAYVLMFVLDEICPVCFATYAINAVLLLLSIFKGSPRLAEPLDAAGAYKKSDGDTAKKALAGAKESKSVPNVAWGCGLKYWLSSCRAWVRFPKGVEFWARLLDV